MHYQLLERYNVSFSKKESRNFGAKIALSQHIVTELIRLLDAIPKVEIAQIFASFFWKDFVD